MNLRTHFASPFRRHSSASQGLTLESWHIVGLLRLPLPVAGVQLALAEPNVSDQLRAIEREGRDLARFPTNRNVNDPHDCFTEGFRTTALCRRAGLGAGHRPKAS
jgi:hypothetical protein